MNVAVGTCGFSYRDWIGPVYPKGTSSARMLEAYAGMFPVVEIDSTYYGVPPETTFASMARRTPAGFRFTAKLPGTGTHVPVEAAGLVHDDVRAFRHSVEPLVAAGKFSAALMQFPSSFHPSDATRDHLAALRRALPDLRLVAEFRNREWQTHATLELLRELNVGFVNVDQPQFASTMRASSDATAELAYVRFHGRNYQQWWKGDNTTRFDHLYTPEELEPWADRVVDLAQQSDVREVLALFNNHRRGQAARNAEMFEAMLAQRLPPGTVRTVEREAQPIAEPMLPLD